MTITLELDGEYEILATNLAAERGLSVQEYCQTLFLESLRRSALFAQAANDSLRENAELYRRLANS